MESEIQLWFGCGENFLKVYLQQSTFRWLSKTPFQGFSCQLCNGNLILGSPCQYSLVLEEGCVGNSMGRKAFSSFYGCGCYMTAEVQLTGISAKSTLQTKSKGPFLSLRIINLAFMILIFVFGSSPYRWQMWLKLTAFTLMLRCFVESAALVDALPWRHWWCVCVKPE